MIKKETITFVEMRTKSGVKDGRPWVLYTMIDENKRKFGTFDTTYTKLQIPLEISYTETPKTFENEEGKTINYTQRNIVEPGEMEEASVSAEKPQEGGKLPQIDPINDKLDRLLKGMELIWKLVSGDSENVSPDEVPDDVGKKDA